MSRQTNVAGAAVLAGLIAGGGVYASGHRVSDPGLTASADARAALMRIHPAAARHVRLLHWHSVTPPKRPRPHAASPAPAAPASAVPAVPVVAASAPTTHTSPAASGDDGTESDGAGDD